MKVKAIKKGYTLKVKSWENDGDNYRTKYYTVPTEKEAKVIVKMCKELLVSNDGGIGNMLDSEDVEAQYLVSEWVEGNPDIFIGFDDYEMWDDAETYDYIIELKNELVGYSEYYISRVVESVQVTYSPEDIYVEEVNYNVVEI